MMETNPYATPEAAPPLTASGIYQDAHTIRREHIKHEASVKSIGILYYLAVFFFGLAAVSGFSGPGSSEAKTIGISIALCFLAILYAVTGHAIRRLKPWARVVGIVLSAIGLLGFPLGTLINAYILYLVASKKGAMVFSPEYKAVIAATPDVKYKTSKVVWIILGVVLLFIFGVLTLAFFAPTF